MRYFIGLFFICICGFVDMYENVINKIMKEEDWKEVFVIGYLINEWLCVICIIYCFNVLNCNVKKKMIGLKFL